MGLQQEQGQLKFYLPHGFDEFNSQSFSDVKSVFFLLYKTLRKLERDNLSSASDRDGARQADGGFRLTLSDEEPFVLYSRLKTIDAILDKYDDTTIVSLTRHLALNEDIDYSKFERIAEYAKYTSNHTPVFDRVPNYTRHLGYSTTDLVSMYCFILMEIKEQMKEMEGIREEIKTLARAFRRKFLTDKSHLFSSTGYSTTIRLLKDALEIIDKHTPYKGDDYWDYFEALEAFLYFEPSFGQGGGIFWGVSNFWSVWEDICHSYAFTQYTDSVMFADVDTEDGQNLQGLPKRVFVADNFVNPFYSNLEGKWLIPDLVVLDSIDVGAHGDLQQSLNQFFEKYMLQVRKDNWDDYGHKTAFKLDIGRVDNPRQKHSTNLKVAKLDDMLSSDEPDSAYYDVSDITENSTSRINEPLPPSHLSLLYVDEELQNFFDTKQELFSLLYALNHIPLLHIVEPRRIPLDRLKNSSIFSVSLFRGLDVDSYIDDLSEIMRDSGYKIIDYKYYPFNYCSDFQSLPYATKQRVRSSLTKQVLYNHALEENNKGLSVSSEFWLPWYFQDGSTTIDELENVDEAFSERKIKVMRLNFINAVESYLDE